MRTVAPSFCDGENIWFEVNKNAFLREYKTLLYLWKVGAIVVAARRVILVKISTVPSNSEAHDFVKLPLILSDRNSVR